MQLTAAAELLPYAAAKSIGFAFSLLVIELRGIAAGVEFEGWCREEGDDGDGECSDDSSMDEEDMDEAF